MIFLFSLSILVSAVENSTNPMILRNINEATANPEDILNMGFGVYQVSAQYNIGGYSNGWISKEENLKTEQKLGALWIESRDHPEVDIILIDGAGNERRVYLPASAPGESSYGEYYWISEDGSSYYAHSSHGAGWPDLEYEEAINPKHLARKSLSPEQRNPDEEEPLKQKIELIGDNSLLLKGQLIDQMTNEPIGGAKLYSAYEFSPEEVITDSNGNFEFIVSSDFGGSWTFSASCYDWAGNIALKKDYELWENGQLKETYAFALRKVIFDSKEEVREISGESEVNIGKIYAWPSADISIASDIAASFNVMYKYKNGQGYNGPGQGSFTKEHYLTSALPLDYEVFIQFEDEEGRKYESSIYTTPADAKCGVISLKYFNENSEWSVLSEVEPTEDSGPIEIKIPKRIQEENPDVVSRFCLGCLKEDLCYPLGYRKSGEYCSEDKIFTSQLKAESSCENNFECDSNLCIDNQCVSSGLWRKFLNWFKKLFG